MELGAGQRGTEGFGIGVNDVLGIGNNAVAGVLECGGGSGAAENKDGLFDGIGLNIADNDNVFRLFFFHRDRLSAAVFG